MVLSSESEYCSVVQCKLLFILCNGVRKSKMCIKQGVLEHSESYVCNILCIIQCAYFAVFRVHQAVCAMCAGQTGCKAGGFRAGAGAAVAVLSSPSSR